MLTLLILLLAATTKYVYDSESIPELLNTSSVVAIRYCTPYSLMCERTQEDFEEAARISRTLNYTYVDVDCSENPDICKQASIIYHPTIHVYINHTMHYYLWDYNPESIINGISKLIFPLVEIVDQYLPAELSKDELARIVIVTNDTDKIEEISNVSKKVSFARFIVSKNAFYFNGKLVNSDTITYFSGLYSDQSSLNLTQDNIHEFTLLQHCRQQPILFGWNTKDLLLKYNHTLVVLFYDFNDSDSKEYLLPFRKFVSKNRQLIYTEATRKSDAVDSLMAVINMKDSDLPKVAIITNGKIIESYRMENIITQETLTEFMVGWSNKQLRKYRRSEPLPVIKAVGSTFDDEVLNSKMDVMVKFYNPLCGACITFGKLFEKLCNKLPLHSNIKCVEVDMTRNEVNGVYEVGFPSMYYYKNKEQPVIYNGSMNSDSLIHFVEDISTVKFKFPEEEEMPEIVNETVKVKIDL